MAVGHFVQARLYVRRQSISAVLLLTLPGLYARAQTISPVIVEYREKARGTFQVRNDTLFPLDVVLEPRSFSVDREGKPTYRPLDPQIVVRLSRMSFRLGPRQTFTVLYDATAQRLPAWFTIYATITRSGPSMGVKLALQLPHTVYLLTKKSLAQDDVVFLKAAVTSPERQIEVEIENRGQEFGRVQEVEVTTRSKKETYAGFPLFPESHRALHLDWDQRGEPERIVLKFAHFRLEQSLRSGARSP